MAVIDDLKTAVREVQDAAKEVRHAGGWENATTLDGVIDRHSNIIRSYHFDRPHLALLRSVFQDKCDAWQKARQQVAESPEDEILRMAVHQDAEDLVAHGDTLLSALQSE